MYGLGKSLFDFPISSIPHSITSLQSFFNEHVSTSANPNTLPVREEQATNI
jgi:hypothetical protein